MRVLIWHVHGSWMTNFVQGDHTYVIPVEPDRGPEGRGRALTWEWPSNAVEAPLEELPGLDVDVVIVQNARQLELVEQHMSPNARRREGLIWLEHNAPQGAINSMQHPAKDRDDLTIVHVTNTNALFWDTGTTRTVVIEHGIIDPGAQWTGDSRRTAVVVNEPARRWRVTGTDLLAHFGAAAEIDLFGLGAGELVTALDRPCWLTAHDDVTQHALHGRLATRRAYLHPFRWTSLGLSLIEAMMLGMPVVALATTEVPEAVPPSAGVVSNDLVRLRDAIVRLNDDHDYAAELGQAGRRHALEHFSLDRFLADWDRLLETTCP